MFPTRQRRDAILAAACDHFSRYGFRGTSLRDIARDAGVSLTLLNHHFDNKAGLLSAVLADNRPMLRQRAAEIKRLRSVGLGCIETVDLVRAWIKIAFETASSPEGQRFLRLLARLDIDGSEEATALRGQLDEGADQFVQALRHCYPGASERAATAAYLCANASLLGIVTSLHSAQDAPEGAQPGLTGGAREWLEHFLVGGIDAALLQPGLRSSATTAPATTDDAEKDLALKRTHADS